MAYLHVKHVYGRPRRQGVSQNQSTVQPASTKMEKTHQRLASVLFKATGSFWKSCKMWNPSECHDVLCSRPVLLLSQACDCPQSHLQSLEAAGSALHGMTTLHAACVCDCSIGVGTDLWRDGASLISGLPADSTCVSHLYIVVMHEHVLCQRPSPAQHHSHCLADFGHLSSSHGRVIHVVLLLLCSLGIAMGA